MDRREELLRQRDEEGDEGGLNADEDEELADLTARALRCGVVEGLVWDCLQLFTLDGARQAGRWCLPLALLSPLPGPAPTCSSCCRCAAGLLQFGYLEDTGALADEDDDDEASTSDDDVAALYLEDEDEEASEEEGSEVR